MYSQIKLGQDIDGEAVDDQSGWSISMSSDGNIVAIGGPRNDGNGSNSGHARIYEWNGTSWSQKGQDINGEAVDDLFGFSISISTLNLLFFICHPAAQEQAINALIFKGITYGNCKQFVGR